MMRADAGDERLFALRQWLPVAIFGLVYIAIGMGIITADPNSRITLETARAAPRVFGQFIFEYHWLSIEIISLLLLVALAGALIIGRRSGKLSAAETTEDEL
jgi:NADH-quinone oxidoreductase subunit J